MKNQTAAAAIKTNAITKIGTKIAAVLEESSAVARAKLISQWLPWKSSGHSHFNSLLSGISRQTPPFSHGHTAGNGRGLSEAVK